MIIVDSTVLVAALLADSDFGTWAADAVAGHQLGAPIDRRVRRGEHHSSTRRGRAHRTASGNDCASRPRAVDHRVLAVPRRCCALLGTPRQPDHLRRSVRCNGRSNAVPALHARSTYGRRQRSDLSVRHTELSSTVKSVRSRVNCHASSSAVAFGTRQVETFSRARLAD